MGFDAKAADDEALFEESVRLRDLIAVHGEDETANRAELLVVEEERVVRRITAYNTNLKAAQDRADESTPGDVARITAKLTATEAGLAKLRVEGFAGAQTVGL